MAKAGTCTTLLAALVVLLTPWLWLAGHCDPAAATPEVTVRLGQTVVTGLRSILPGGQHVRKFLGLRYGQAPRRFEPPVRAELPPAAAVDARHYGARCPQGPAYTPSMSEDCLFLNIFVPGDTDTHMDTDTGTSDLLPVLVWVHGGGFIVGAADVYEAEELAGEGRIVVVTLNYRLGPFGFLSTGDASSPGNYGLWDQRLALQWVQDHIASFGGDRARVTVGGVSAGAASASLLALSPEARGLFRHVMQLSGSATAPWARVSADAALEAARALGRGVGCEHNVSTQSLVSCLRGQPVGHLVASSIIVFPDQVGRSLVDFVWGPVEDGSLVRSVDTAATFSGPLLAGLVNNEGDTLLSWTVPRVSHHIPDARALLRDPQFFLRHFLPSLLKQAYPGWVPLPWPTNHQEQEEGEGPYERPPYLQALQRLQCAYRGEGEEGTVGEEVLRAVYGDQGFVQDTVRLLDKVGEHQPSFLYFVDYQTERPGIAGIRHLDDLVFLFGFNTTLSRKWLWRDGHVTDVDLELLGDLRRLFVNFIKTGDPNDPKRPQGWPLWTPYTSKGPNYLRISPSPAVLSHLKADKMALWLKEIPRILSSVDNSTDGWQCHTSAASTNTMFAAMAAVLVWVTALCT
ncbi:acetylcholinesterase-like [Babylonia areolata]|uniref:acetylcholinesterase-like n=1 Tax=Babylonia areolata TaxID=304850 RepID=UPI003FD26953